MSVYTVHKLLHRAQVDLEFREALRADPGGAIADWPFTDEERTALLSGDVAALARGGAHTFLLSRIPRFGLFGLDRDDYIRRMQALRNDAEPALDLRDRL